ncbi:hypothetical protein [Nocardioides sp.]|uniref:hypothetical protein n=1 Tax=Nocardioides sp. TaxID=35761 RepID=UPI002ED0F989
MAPGDQWEYPGKRLGGVLSCLVGVDMSNGLVLGIVFVALVVALIAGFAAGRRPSTVTELPVSASSVDPILAPFIECLHVCESEEDERYVVALTRLRERPEEVSAAIRTAYPGADESAFDFRRSLLLTANRLEHPTILPFLAAVAGTSAQSRGAHEGGQSAAASDLRLTALDGIEAMAVGGVESAADALLDLVTSNDRAVQAGAVVALTHAEGFSDRLARVRELLPENRQYLLDVRRVDVRDASQIADPTGTLSGILTTDNRPDPNTGEVRGAPTGPHRQTPRAAGGTG